MGALHHSDKKDLRKERDTEKYGHEAAEQLALVRNIWGISKRHARHRWAIETCVRRRLEGDIKRIQSHKKCMRNHGNQKVSMLNFCIKYR
jgi:hypothetical protein